MNKKTIIITGADGGLGRTVAALLLKQGYALRASAFNQKSIDTLHALFPEHSGNQLQSMVADLSNETDVKRLIGDDSSVMGLVHLAGGYKPGASVSDYSMEDFQYLMDLNVLPTFLLLKHIFPLLNANRGGSIVTIGAKPAIHQARGNAVYAASKSAVITLTMSTAEEGRTLNINANCIAPETLQTPNNLSWASPEQYKTFTPTGDIAEVIAFLMSDNGKSITGMVIPMFNKENK
jgi:NAD(P)-dependent dehydrogenase (short-subunit alcohol dehydrogenase family)